MNLKEFPTVTVIFRGFSTEQVLTAMEVLNESKQAYAVEITLNSPDVYATIGAVSKKYGEQFWIGAGTVKNGLEAQKAIYSGATFILSPIALDKETLNYCRKKNILTVPSGLTPTEVWELYENHADIIKIFPITSVSTDHMNALKGPLGNIPFMAVGGVTKENAKFFLENGADYVGMSSGLFNKEDIQSMNQEELRNSLREFEEVFF